MKKVLIANRGEIARRIIRTCKYMGIQTIAVYSEADAELPFVKEADFAFLIGKGPVQQSYLKGEELIELAVREGADAIHPGYGLLSENGDFAKKVEEANLVFIGPNADTIRLMGDKIASRKTMITADVPVVPGTDDGIDTLGDAVEAAKKIGYPVMLKASAGGGGVGMIRCETEQALVQQFESVKNRAKAYFGSDLVFIEKFVVGARHVEVQIFGDHSGNIVHLFERNCSVQRRNQKVIEESPSPALSDQARNGLFEAAVKAAKAVKYTNAGTVEFIVDQDETFYFLEMNTRLQVEHPVTEAVTNLDLVEWQIRIASGEELPIKEQNEIPLKGHAIEYRIYAEDPEKFMPSPGKITLIHWDGQHARIDSGYEEGNQVTPFYDPMIAKVIIHGESREEAINKSKEFFKDASIEGVKTNVPFFREFVESEEFKNGDYATDVIGKWQQSKKGVL
ncbi:acetyl/propionyl/methylcrotonyl-CoA carboxylase subunit alpha [Chungangia koreensis]|uniref:Acetyl/propionyl/methylcrotonyl-CoA carboxylase subunit alpha n=1 Tax=Chungangia koreensis TaxID=752657 RepID=A0ABV8X2V5_9LACT